MDRPATHIAACAASHARLRVEIAGLTDSDVRQRSLLPGWSIGHLLTHLARNADSVVRRLDAAARGELVDQYPGGAAAREAEIEAGAARSAAALRDDVLAASDAVDRALAGFDDGAWDRPIRQGRDLVLPAAVLPFRRWREVEVHLVDLGRGYSPADWPLDLVDAWLPEALAALPERTDPRQLLAWALRRAEPPPLEPY